MAPSCGSREAIVYREIQKKGQTSQVHGNSEVCASSGKNATFDNMRGTWTFRKNTYWKNRVHIQSYIHARIPAAAYAILGNDTFTFDRGSTHPQSSNHPTKERNNEPQPRPLPRKNPIESGTQLWPTRESQDHFTGKTRLGAEPSSGPPEKTKTMPRTPFTRHPCTGLCQCTVPLGRQNRQTHRAEGFSHCSYCERLCIEKIATHPSLNLLTS